MAAGRNAIGGVASVEMTKRSIDKRRDGRVQNEDVDLPRSTVGPEMTPQRFCHRSSVLRIVRVDFNG
jgi:hypothetical protein